MGACATAFLLARGENLHEGHVNIYKTMHRLSLLLICCSVAAHIFGGTAESLLHLANTCAQWTLTDRAAGIQVSQRPDSFNTVREIRVLQDMLHYRGIILQICMQPWGLTRPSLA